MRLHYLNAGSFHAEAGVRSLSRAESMWMLAQEFNALILVTGWGRSGSSCKLPGFGLG